MNQVKIGRFIAEQRKAVGLTQQQLAEKLDITDRAVSKWENGRSLPDAALMLDLCKILGITVTELLEGEKGMEKNEELLLQIVKEKQEADKRLLKLEWVIGILSMIVLMIPIFVAAMVSMEAWKRIVLVFSGFIPAIIGFLIALRIEQVAGYYKCGHCGHTYVPTYAAMNMAMHMGRTRYLKCPKCGKRTWNKKVIAKDE